MTNIYRCKICKREVIAEELDIHECRNLSGYTKEGDIIKIFDGYFWYPLKLRSPPRFQHPFKTPKEPTEPKILKKTQIKPKFFARSQG